MWDLIVSVPDNCLSFYFAKARQQRYQEIKTAEKATLPKSSVSEMSTAVPKANGVLIWPLHWTNVNK